MRPTPARRMLGLWNMLVSDREWSKIIKMPSPTNGTEPCGEKQEFSFAPSTAYFRECAQHHVGPIEGTVRGLVPDWLEGNLVQNSPGKFDFGEQQANHWFDGAALLQKFIFNKGKVSYESKFLNSEMYEKNVKSRRFCFNEFGTAAQPDPCQTIYQRFFSQFNPPMTDNCVVSLYPIGGNLFAFTESPKIHNINVDQLQSMKMVDLNSTLRLTTQTAHPHVVQDGTAYNVGLSKEKDGKIVFAIFEIPNASNGGLDGAKILHKVPISSDWHPGYMHSFGITENYFVLVDQPLTFSIPSLLLNVYYKEPFCHSFRWKEIPVKFHIINRKTGEVKTHLTETFFFFHSINQFERDGTLVLDLCCYKDPNIINGLFMEALKNGYVAASREAFHSTPTRFVIPLDGSEAVKTVKLSCVPCELPRFNYDLLGKPYKFFYGISFQENSTGEIIKVNADTKELLAWKQCGAFPNEPIFIPSPNSKAEDDGILLFTAIWSEDPCRVDLMVLDAKTMKEKACVTFSSPCHVPKSIHGWFQ